MCSNKKWCKAKKHLFKTLTTWNTFELMTLQIMINHNERNWQNTTKENGDSLVKDGGTLTNLVMQLDVLSNVYKCNFNTMLRLATMVLLEETKRNPKHWVLLQRKWNLDHWILSWISDTWHEVEEKQIFVRQKRCCPRIVVPFRLWRPVHYLWWRQQRAR
jgi:hypothetical protein